MKRNRKVFRIAILLLLAIVGFYFYYGVIFKESRKIESEIPAFSTTATKLTKEYNSNPKKADSLYLNKTIAITGIITKVTDSVVILEHNIFCLLSKKIKNGFINDKITIKGKCIGYDELFEEVKLDQCTIINTNN